MQSDKVVHLADRRPERRPLEYAVVFRHRGDNKLTFKVLGAGSTGSDRELVGNALLAAGLELLGGGES